MTHKLFEDFLNDPGEYEACELFWKQLVQDVAESLGQTGEWQPWIPRYYGDGITPMEQDGNPIFDGRSQKLNRAFRIIQQPTVSDEVEIAAWLNHEEEYIELPRDEMVINLCLSQEAAELARTLLRYWMTPTTSKEDMESFIDRTIEQS